MKSSARLVGLLAASAFGATVLAGCNFIVPIQKNNYQPATGTVASVGALSLENMIIASSGKDAAGRLVGAVVNPSGEGARITLTAVTGDTTIFDKTLNVAANSTVQFTGKGDSEIKFPKTGALPGSLVTMKAESAGKKTSFAVPVLNAETPYLKTIVPNPETTPSSGAPSPADRGKASPAKSGSPGNYGG